MKTLEIKCKLITPMFMFGGMEGNPELRPSEFKGMMRWWWRAIKAEDNINKLRKEEAEIFGGTGKGEGKSKVRLRIKLEGDLSSFIRTKNLKEIYNISNNKGISYLLYSTILPNKSKSFIDVGYEFSINLTSYDDNAFKNAVAALWTAIYLGGFGTRARRGGGNLAVIEAKPSKIEGLNFICDAKGVEELKGWFERNLEAVKELCNAKSGTGTSKYTTLKCGKILLFEQPKKDWKDALDYIGEKYKEFRGEKYKKFRSEKKDRIFDIAAFGMPIMYKKGKERMVPYEDKEKRLSDRWSSPVIFKVIKEGSDRYFPMIVILNPGGIEWVGREGKNGKKWEAKCLKMERENGEERELECLKKIDTKIILGEFEEFLINKGKVISVKL